MMRCRLLILIAVLAIPLSLIAGPAVQAASAHVSTPASDTKASQKTVIVSATQPWTDTGISLPAGTVSFKASGTINVSGGDPAFNETPAGDGSADPQCIAGPNTPWGDDWIADGLPCWSLIGQVKNGPAEIGNGGTFRVLSPGELYLGVDDQADAFGDNSGSWTVQVSLTSPGQQSLQLNVPFNTEIGSAGVWGSGSNNCGPASVTMAIRYYGGSTTVAASAIAIRGSNNSANGITDFKSSATGTWLAKFGLTEKNITTLSEIQTELAAGHPVIILVNNNAYRQNTPPPYPLNGNKKHDDAWFTYAHIVVVTGINSADVIINDPLQTTGNYAIPLAMFETAASTARADGSNGPATGSTWYAASILRG